MVKKVVKIVLFILLSLLIIFHKLVIYGVEQGIGQLKIVYSAELIEEVMKDNTVPDSVKRKLQLIQEIKQFAEDSLGINKSKNYTTFYDQKGQPAIWVITASDPYKLEAYEWKFPFIGSFSYKGFFNKKRAIREENILQEEGYDTDLGTASGWSTLGWFKDPVLSGMLKRKEGSLANLIIHELTHGTLYIKDSVEYNENLANFIGDKGAVKFLEFKYGPESRQLDEYEKGKKDRDRYIAHILKGADRLDSLYKTIAFEEKKRLKEKKKRVMIKNIILTLDTIDFYNKNYYGSSSLDLDSINNTFFIGYQRYNSKQDNFEEEFSKRFNGDIKLYLKYLKNKYPSL